MKITLAVLFLAGLTIYCKCVAVLSLPPSLSAHGAASSLDDIQNIQKPSVLRNNEISKELRQQQQEQLFGRQQANEESSRKAKADFYRKLKNLWPNNLSFLVKKRERNTFDDDIDNVYDVAIKAQQQQQPAIEIIKRSSNRNNIIQKNDLKLYDDNNKYKSNNNNKNNKNENMLLKASAAVLKNENYPTEFMNDYVDSRHAEKFVAKREAIVQTPLSESEILNSYLKPLKYWTDLCSLENEGNCLQEYYGDLMADRNNALKKQLPYMPNIETSQHINHLTHDDIVLLLTAEQNLIKFLSWALSELYPFGKLTHATDSDSADYYHPGMYMWKKLNLSGRLEPPLLVEEPHYVIIRKDLNTEDDDNEYKRGLNYGRDPFIPPRGRKHNLPDLDSLLHRYETFVPNRGRRDKIKDIFKNDDLFYPNRGKRQMIATPTSIKTVIDNNNGDIDESPLYNDDIKNFNEENADKQQLPDPSLPSSNKLFEYIENLIEKMKRNVKEKNQKQNNEKIANSFDEMMSNEKEPTKMSTTSQLASVSGPMSAILLNKRLKSAFNILHNRQQQHRQHQLQQHLPKHYKNRHQWWKRYTTSAAAPAALADLTANNNDKLWPEIRSPTMATNRLQYLRSVLALQQHLTQQQQQPVNLSPSHSGSTNFILNKQQQPKSLAQQFDPLSWHKLTMQHPRLTALQHLSVIQQQHKQQQELGEHALMPQDNQLTYGPKQFDSSIGDDLDNNDNKLDFN